MERIEIVTALVAAHIAAKHTPGIHYVQTDVVRAAALVADEIRGDNTDFLSKTGAYRVHK